MLRERIKYRTVIMEATAGKDSTPQADGGDGVGFEGDGSGWKERKGQSRQNVAPRRNSKRKASKSRSETQPQLPSTKSRRIIGAFFYFYERVKIVGQMPWVILLHTVKCCSSST